MTRPDVCRRSIFLSECDSFDPPKPPRRPFIFDESTTSPGADDRQSKHDVDGCNYLHDVFYFGCVCVCVCNCENNTTAGNIFRKIMRLDISTTVSRRATAMQAALALFASTTTLTSPLPAVAFENRLPPDELELKYKQRRRQDLSPPTLACVGGGGKPCIDGKPHCFSSTRSSLTASKTATAT